MSTGGGRGKSKVVAGILAILLGGLGVHHFYLGSTMAGVICLLLSCLCVGGLLGLVEGIMLLTMSDADFDAKYNARTPESMEFVFTKK
jgi:TM2 domain-containing membrane protein YozV